MAEGTKLEEMNNNNQLVENENQSDTNNEDSLQVANTQDVSSEKKEDNGTVNTVDSSDSSALSDNDLFENEFEKQLEDTVIDYSEGDIIKGVVRSVEKSGVLVDVNFKSDGFIPNNEFSNDSSVNPRNSVKPGDEVNVYIEKLETKEGYTQLSKKHADYELAWGELFQLYKSKETIDIKVSSKVGGGLVAEYNGIKGFIPASHVLDSEENLDGFVGQVLTVAVIKVDRRRRKVIFSTKATKTRRRAEDIEKVFQSIDVGQVVKGQITSVKDFGVFVDIGGAEGLVHISEMSWSRIQHPSDIAKVGDEVDVFILGIDRENNKVSLGLKQLQKDPWVEVTKKYDIGQEVDGTVSRITPFGAFLKLSDNLEGLIHISEISKEHVEKIEDKLSVGDEVKAKIIKLVPNEQKIGLSIRLLDSDQTE